MTATFVAFELGWRRRFGIALAWLVAARPEGVLIALLFAAFLALGKLGGRASGDDAAPRPGWRSFLPALFVGALLFAWRARDGSSLYGGFLVDILTPDAARLDQGVAYARDGLLTTGAPFLLVFPLTALLLRRLSGTGKRALGIAAGWCLLVVLAGGAEPEFALGFVPAWPVLCIALQQGILAALDTYRRMLEVISWVALVGAAMVAALASKFPGNLGPLPAEAPHRAWMQASTRPPYGRGPALGRVGLRDELLQTCQLRDLGAWMQANLKPERSVLTPWPGAVGYLSRTVPVALLRVPGATRLGKRTNAGTFTPP
jgi:hypothetical protein